MSRAKLGYFEQVMIPNKKQEKKNRVPVRFADDDAPPVVEENGPDAGVVSDSNTSVDVDSGHPNDRESEQQHNVDDVRDQDVGAGVAEDYELKDSETPALAESTELMEENGNDNISNSASMSDESSTSPQGMKTAAGPMLAELIATRAELRRVETERNDLLERLARRQADFENYRKRVERERNETYQRMVGDVVSKLLPVMDNMRRALEAESLMEKNESAEFRHFLRGVELVYKQLNDALEELGVEAVPSVGQPFDPHLHEAVATEHSEEYEPDIVTQELLRGYRLGEKLLRPAMVKVSTKQ